MAIPPTPAGAYTVWYYQDGTPVKQVGWATSEPGAYTFASGWLNAAEQMYPTQGAAAVIIDTSRGSTVIAYLAWERPQGRPA